MGNTASRIIAGFAVCSTLFAGCGRPIEFIAPSSPLRSVPAVHDLNRNSYAKAVEWRHRLDELVGRPVYHMDDGTVRLGRRCVKAGVVLHPEYIKDGKVLEALVDHRTDEKLRALVLDHAQLDAETMVALSFTDVLQVYLPDESIDETKLRAITPPPGVRQSGFISGATLSSLVRKHYGKVGSMMGIGALRVPGFSFGYEGQVYSSTKMASYGWRIHCTEVTLPQARQQERLVDVQRQRLDFDRGALPGRASGRSGEFDPLLLDGHGQLAEPGWQIVVEAEDQRRRLWRLLRSLLGIRCPRLRCFRLCRLRRALLTGWIADCFPRLPRSGCLVGSRLRWPRARRRDQG